MARPAPPDLSDSRRPLRGVARSYPAGHRVDAHEHAWGQVLYAVSGMMWLETPDEALPVPPQRAVWLPPGLRHAVRVASELQMRNIYLSPELSRGLEDRTLVLVVGPLLRELIVSLVEQERQSDPDYYRALADLAVLELGRARRSSLRVPLPDASDRRLLALCQAVMANPSLDIGLERLAEDAGASVRTPLAPVPAQPGHGLRRLAAAGAAGDRLRRAHRWPSGGRHRPCPGIYAERLQRHVPPRAGRLSHRVQGRASPAVPALTGIR